VDRPEIHYARSSGNVYVGYQAFGSGPFDLVVVPGFLSNIDYGWEFESWRNYYAALASIARVLLFDKRSREGSKAAHAAGHRIHWPGKRTNQLGATFVLAPGNDVVYEHIDEHSADHAPLDDVMAALGKAAGVAS